MRPTANDASNFLFNWHIAIRDYYYMRSLVEDSADHLTSTRDLFSSDVKGLLKQNREVLFRYTLVHHFVK